MQTVVVAEKPAVARDIAGVLGATRRGEGCFRGGDYIVTWAIGHLVALAEPHEMNPSWKRWRFADLPLLPESWPLLPVETTRKQFEIVRALLRAPEVTKVVCATDAGREGELIFRYIYEAARCTKPVQRLWISSLTPRAIAEGFRQLRPGQDFDALADAARGRSRADWLVGMNLSRAYSLSRDDNLSVGRVQTPTLAMLVERELAIRSFVPEDYLDLVANFRLQRGPAPPEITYDGIWFEMGADGKQVRRLPANGERAALIVARVLEGKARVAAVEQETRRLPPPLLYDLAELQRHANRLYGMTAQRTLEVAQVLYERHKVLSYPRTDSRYLTRATVETLPAIVGAVAPMYPGLTAPGSGARPLGPRFVNDARVGDHHAIVPTDQPPPRSLGDEEQKIYDLVCRRLLAAWHGDYVFAVTNVETEVKSPDAVDRFASTGTSVEDEGWKVLDVRTGRSRKSGPGDDVAPDLPPGLRPGEPTEVRSAKPLPKKTRAPLRFTDGTLLTAMESAGRALDEKEMSDAMREHGLGTAATRAAILETLLRRAYAVREGKALCATDKGIELVEMVHPAVKSAAMTGEWEAKLARVERGTFHLAAFLGGIESYVREVVASVVSQGGPASPAPAALLRTPGPGAPKVRDNPAAPVGPEELESLLRREFGFASFRPHQQMACEATTKGSDVLLVMPTGAGKSLCYQLPGVARGGTTLVVSPLIALMEDQVAKLVAQGFAAERIHSGRSRPESRAACAAYLRGDLHFLFIAPERLKVPGFPEMLAKRKPVLVAVDEAHCISQWGHDFRPEYRMLGERLPLLRPAPIIALTATATPAVQSDIVVQLGLRDATRFIHGFRRTNIALEVVLRTPGERAEATVELLRDKKRLPAIIYAPTRKHAESLALQLAAGRIRSAAYHAGLVSKTRSQVQEAFLAGRLDAVVATIAFGMGIDKADVRTVIHTALPATLEGYYQELGRAGRDGLPSRAILFHSFVDTKTHEFFLERDYPAADVLGRILDIVPARAIAREDLIPPRGVDADVFEKALEKLWLHGAIVVDADDRVSRGSIDFRPAYERQKSHRRDQIARIRRYAATPSCRMLQVVGHFGDQQDDGAVCGQCDICAPESAVASTFRPATEAEAVLAGRMLALLEKRDGVSVGQLHREHFAADLERGAFDRVLGGLARAGKVRVQLDEFVKAGETIAFQRVFLGDRPSAPGFQSGKPLAYLDADAKRSTKRKRVASTASRARPSRRPAAKGRAIRAHEEHQEGAAARTEVVAALRAWRLAESKRKGIPAFRVLTDRTLLLVAAAEPRTEPALLDISGMGPALMRKYGRVILEVVGGVAHYIGPHVDT